MSILTDLEAALEACDCDENCVECPARPCYHEQLVDLVVTEEDGDYSLLAALVAVARAMHDENNSSGEAKRQAYVRGRAALATLVKEADDE